MSLFQKLDTWHQTKTGLLVFGLVEAGLAYVFISWAIDAGSLFDWFLGVVMIIGTVQNFVKLTIKVVPYGSKH